MMMMMMNDQQIFVSWRHHPLYIHFPFHFPPINKPSTLPVVVRRRTRLVQSYCCLLEQQQQQQQQQQQEYQMTAKEKRELRNEKRDLNKSYNWREEVEEKLLQKPKKQFNSWKEELNLDKLAVLGPQWWILKVSRAKGKDTVERLMQSLHKNFPDSEFKVFTAAIYEKNKLKNGKISVKPKPLYPGCVFLNCILNRELHNFIKEDCQGVGGFVGRMVGNTKRQINKPRPVSEDDMEAIFQEVKEKQEASDKAFEEEHLGGVDPDNKTLSISDKKVITKRRTRKPSGPLLGSNVRILSGTFADFSGTIKKLDKKRGLATVGFTLFGKETVADLKLTEVAEDQN